MAPTKKINNSESIKKSARLLCCAPSNAACDEIIRRLKQGVIQSNGQKMIPKIVRLGSSDAIHADVKDVTLELLVEESFTSTADFKKLMKNSTVSDQHEKEFREKLNELNADRDRIRAEQTSEDLDMEKTSNLDVEMRLNNQKRKEVLEMMTLARDNKSNNTQIPIYHKHPYTGVYRLRRRVDQ
jgi:superfamily I DNA and/or RNA helicase